MGSVDTQQANVHVGEMTKERELAEGDKQGQESVL